MTSRSDSSITTPKVETARELAQRAYSMCDEEQPQRTVDALAAAIAADRAAVVAQALAPLRELLEELRREAAELDSGAHGAGAATVATVLTIAHIGDRLARVLAVEKATEQ
jgi:hypothetical protein